MPISSFLFTFDTGIFLKKIPVYESDFIRTIIKCVIAITRLIEKALSFSLMCKCIFKLVKSLLLLLLKLSIKLLTVRLINGPALRTVDDDCTKLKNYLYNC